MRFAAAALIVTLASSARAAIYENTVNVDDEDDLFAMEQRGDISSATADTLLELLREGVDLNSGSREALYDLPSLTYTDVDAILEYRKQKGRIEDPAELVGAGAITPEQLLSIAPFIRIDAARPILPVSGKFRAFTQVTTTDNVAPPALLSGRLRGPFDLTAGFSVITTRRRPETPAFDLATDTLVTPGFDYQVNLPRAFVQWNSAKRRLVAGTFTIGFAERLVLDNTARSTPNGIYLTDDFRRPIDLTRTCKLSSPDQPLSGDCASGAKNLYVTPDLSWRETFRGVAGSVEDLSFGESSSLSMYGFLSYQTRSIYQYELYDRKYCADPRDDLNQLCKAPPVYLTDNSTRLIYTTLPYLFDELAGGGHVTFKPNYRFTFGVTGYGALPIFRTGGDRLDFQEWSRWPNGGSWGAVGLNAAAGLGDFNFFLEAARSFDRTVGNGGGGYAVEQRSTFSPKHQEFELSLRFYDLHYANPFARPISSPDEYDGQRARNEAGIRLRYFGAPNKDWEFRGRVDFWVNPFEEPGRQPGGVANLYALARADFTGWRAVQPSLWVDVRNRNLASNQRGTCASGTVLLVEGQPYLCNGDLYRIAARVEFVIDPKYLRLATQGWFTWTDDVRYKDRFRNDVLLWAEARSNPLDQLQLRVKTRWSYQDISDNGYLEHNLWSFVEAAWLPTRGTRLAVRYDMVVWLDTRNSTLSRVPNPEHRFMLDLRTGF